MNRTRIFATVEAFRLACPLCTGITVIEASGTAKRRRHSAKPKARRAYNLVRACWDSRHQVLRCAWCGAVWQIGLVVRPKGGRHPRQRPADIVPTRKELAQLRNLYGGGWWIDDPHTQDRPINVYVPEPCTCAPDPWRATCPVHGEEAVRDGSSLETASAHDRGDCQTR